MKNLPLRISLAFLLTLTSLAYAETLTLTTYYPSPLGIYDQLRLVPKAPMSGACQPGTFYIRNDTLTIEICQSGAWTGAGGGYWTKSGSNLYPNDLTWNVGIGTATPSSRLHIAGGNIQMGVGDDILLNSGDVSTAPGTAKIEFSGTGVGGAPASVEIRQSQDYGGGNHYALEVWPNFKVMGYSGFAGAPTNQQVVAMHGSSAPPPTLESTVLRITPNNVPYSIWADYLAGIAFTVKGDTGDVGIGTWQPAAKLQINQVGAANALLVEDEWTLTGDPTPFVIDQSGKVGIGTTAPSGMLHVSGGIPAIALTDTDTANQHWLVRAFSNGVTGTNQFSVQYTPDFLAISNHFTIDTNGNTGIGTTTPANRLDVEGAAVIGATYSGTNVAPANGLLVEGNVGIGATAPTGILQVSDKLLIFDDTGAPTDNDSLMLGTFGNEALEIYGPNGRDSGGGIHDREMYYSAQQHIFRTPYPTPTEIMRIDSTTGRVGIGVGVPAYPLDVAGDVHATAFPVSSDLRFKTNVEPLSDVLAKLQDIRSVTFKWNQAYEQLGRSNGKHRQIGLIAQEVEKVFPELVPAWGDGSGYLGVDYGRFVVVLLQAIKEQQQEIEGQQQEIETLKSKIEQLIKRTARPIKP